MQKYQEPGASSRYFEAHKARAIELEDAFLPQFYAHIARQYTMARGDDLTAVALQRKEHVDAVIMGRDRQIYYVEHKFDFYKPLLEQRGRPRNVLIETVMNVRRNSPGWSVTTRADFLLFAFERPAREQCLEVYLISWPTLKAWLQEHQGDYPSYTNRNKPNPSTFLIVPIADIQAAMPVRFFRIYADGRVDEMAQELQLPQATA